MKNGERRTDPRTARGGTAGAESRRRGARPAAREAEEARAVPPAVWKPLFQTGLAVPVLRSWVVLGSATRHLM